MKNKIFEEYLQDKFFNLREVNGVPIRKDNFESMFDSWLANQDGNDLIQYAEEAISIQVEKSEKLLALVNEAISELNKIKEMINLKL